uniref:MARVEL domain-containing protein n=1 Tax=Marseillevirus LCMAC103 TaxID=2506604 RepID=A0A481YVI7_9VIRU|nr:MAG: hypothetical protein LCMAC103_02550 [Marseillevirus LCMAC103]
MGASRDNTQCTRTVRGTNWSLNEMVEVRAYVVFGLCGVAIVLACSMVKWESSDYIQYATFFLYHLVFVACLIFQTCLAILAIASGLSDDKDCDWAAGRDLVVIIVSALLLAYCNAACFAGCFAVCVQPAAETRAVRDRRKPAAETRAVRDRRKPAAETRAVRDRRKPAAETRAVRVQNRAAETRAMRVQNGVVAIVVED